MLAAIVVVGCFACYAAGYLVYSRFLSQRVFAARSDHPTPAHAVRRVVRTPRVEPLDIDLPGA